MITQLAGEYRSQIGAMRLGFGEKATYSLAGKKLPDLAAVRGIVREKSRTAYRPPLTRPQYDCGIKHVVVVETAFLPDDLVASCNLTYLSNFGAYAFTPRVFFSYVNSRVAYDPRQSQAASLQYTNAFPVITGLRLANSYLHITAEDLQAFPAEIRRLTERGIGFLSLVQYNNRTELTLGEMAGAVTGCNLQLIARPPLEPRRTLS